MKTPGKIALVAAALCVVTATVCACDDRTHVSGSGGRKLEFRLAAFNTERIHPDRFTRAPNGPDVFSGAEAQQIAESGIAPVAFGWLPISDFLLGQGGGVQPMGITRVVNGHEYLLVTDRPEIMLKHAANSPAWRVKSVQITATYEYGPVVKRVEIKLDNTGERLLRQFTQVYRGHSLALVVNGQVISNVTLLTPVTKGILGLTFPASEQAEAERLCDFLMK